MTLAAEPYVLGITDATAMAVAPDGSIYVTLRQAGVVALVRGGRVVGDFARIPVLGGGERGLLGIALDPAFPATPFVYVFFTDTAPDGGPRSRIARLTAQGDRASALDIVLDNLPAAGVHNGGILAFGPDGKLWVTLGDHTRPPSAQDPASLDGKVLRLNADGSIPPDNPFPGSPVFTLGHRNVFGLAFDPVTGRPFITENGPTDSDEVNLLVPGGNYGWPVVRGVAHDPRFVDPIFVFEQSVAPTNALFYAGGPLAALEGDLLFGDFLNHGIHRLILGGPGRNSVEGHGVVYTSAAGPVLDVKEGADGLLYFTTGNGIYRATGLLPGAPTAGNGPGSGPGLVVPLAVAAALPVAALLLWRRRRRRRP